MLDMGTPGDLSVASSWSHTCMAGRRLGLEALWSGRRGRHRTWAADPEFCRKADWTADLLFTSRRRLHQTSDQLESRQRVSSTKRLVRWPPRGGSRLDAGVITMTRPCGLR